MAGGALPGFRDFYPDEFAQRAHIFKAWREVARRYAFVEYDGPPLEPLELYTKKSGEEITRQLYAFTDKGGREVALRPEMTPTFARMVSERVNALRKPVRWFSIPQLFRYERSQRGRLREHFQLNVDIVGEASELADAELLAFAIDVMRELGLKAGDVKARVSDRGLLIAMLDQKGVQPGARGAVFETLDKSGREEVHNAGNLRLQEAGLSTEQLDFVISWLMSENTLESISDEFAQSEIVAPHIQRLTSYFGHLNSLGVSDEWVVPDLSIVRGLAYYTGTVFELFDTNRDLRAICGGGRYDNLLEAIGGVDLPALGFGMGDVVLGELLKERGLMPRGAAYGADLFIVGGNGALDHPIADALRLVRVLRGAGLSVDHALNAERYKTQATRNQVDSAKKSGARAAVYFESATDLVLQGLIGKLNDAPKETFAAGPLLEGDPLTMDRLVQWFRKHFPPGTDRKPVTDSDSNPLMTV